MNTKTNKPYNINEMRKALQNVRDGGNRKSVTLTLCRELGITEAYFSAYKTHIETLYTAVARYCRIKHTPSAKPEEVKAAFEAMFPAWKELLSTSEKDKRQSDLHVDLHDIYDLISFCQTFMNDSNNVDGAEDFVAKKSWAIDNLSRFNKKVETMLGIKIARIDVMSDTERERLRAESKYLGAIKKANNRVEELTKTKALYEAKAKEYPKAFEDLLADINVQIDTQQKKVASNRDALQKLDNPGSADGAEVSGKKGAVKPKRNKSKPATNPAGTGKTLADLTKPAANPAPAASAEVSAKTKAVPATAAA